MSLTPISLPNGISAAARAESLPSGNVGESPFSQLASRLIQDVNGEQQAADKAIQAFATGETNNVHDVVLSMAKADLEFRFLLEIRNRLIDAYQELMRMQV
jgi:flagellar hook-basal body complex protein FliE